MWIITEFLIFTGKVHKGIKKQIFAPCLVNQWVVFCMFRCSFQHRPAGLTHPQRLSSALRSRPFDFCPTFLLPSQQQPLVIRKPSLFLHFFHISAAMSVSTDSVGLEWPANRVRETFLDYFQQREHTFGMYEPLELRETLWSIIDRFLTQSHHPLLSLSRTLPCCLQMLEWISIRQSSWELSTQPLISQH